MVDYLCIVCNKIVKFEELRRRIACPYCGGRILSKKRPQIEKEVPAV